MNVFGIFNFGKFIKTFLPGFTIVIAIIFGLDAVSFIMFNGQFSLFSLLSNQAILVTLIIIPFSIIIGIFSNMVFYAGLNDLFIRKPVRLKNKELFDCYDNLMERLVAKSSDKLIFAKIPKDTLKKNIDPIFFLLNSADLHKILFIQESYWYYLEFQMNIFFSIIISFPILVFWISAKANQLFHWSNNYLSIILFIINFILCSLCLVCARKNYKSYIVKLLSYYTGLIAEKNDNSKSISIRKRRYLFNHLNAAKIHSSKHQFGQKAKKNIDFCSEPKKPVIGEGT